MSEYNIQMNKYNALNVEYDQLYPATKIENVDGLNIALQNKAPAGFGYGGVITKFIVAQNESELETALDDFINQMKYDAPYQIRLKIESVSTNSQYLATIMGGNASYAVVHCVSFLQDNSSFFKRKIGGTWRPIEWENPPMSLGVEYRTTERYQGKPVYTQVITVDGGVAGAIYYTEKSVSGADQLVGYEAKLWGWSIPTNILGNSFGNSQSIIDATARVSASHVNCYFYSPGRDTTGATAYFTVRYTKSTD